MRTIAYLPTIALLCLLSRSPLSLAAEEMPKTGEKRDTLLYVRTDPPGAKVLLDGKELGKSDGLFTVEPGVGKVVVELEGHKSNFKQVTIQASGIARVTLKLKPDGTTSNGKPAGGSADAQQLSQEGWRLWQQGKFDEAIAKFKESVKLAPKNENAWNGLGWASFNSGNMDEAKKAFLKVIALNPKHPAALNGLGQLYLGQKKYDLAEKYLLKAAPQAPAAWYGLTKLYLLQGKFEPAEKFAQRIEDSGQGDDMARRMLKAAKEKNLPEGLRVVIEPQGAVAEGTNSAALETQSEQSGNATSLRQPNVVEGVGWGGFRVGATREELIKAFGPLEPNSSPSSKWMGWYSKHHIDCWFDQSGRAVEVRFNEGFDLPLTSGVKIGSPEREVLLAYGSPDRVVDNGDAKMLEYKKPGVLMWINDGHVSEFTVIQPRTDDLRTKQAAKARARMARDKRVFSPQELRDIESLYQVANKKWQTDEGRNSIKTLVAKYKKANRTGCSLVYLGQMSQDTNEQINYFKQAIADYSDCYYGDGVQVGAFARYLLGQAYLKMGDADKAKTLFDEIRKHYPDSIDHGGNPLVAQLPKE